jgi:hypothetical protein
MNVETVMEKRGREEAIDVDAIRKFDLFIDCFIRSICSSSVLAVEFLQVSRKMIILVVETAIIIQ